MTMKKPTQPNRNTEKNTDTEYSKEIAENAEKYSARPEKKNSGLKEKPANFDLYPGE